MDGDTDGRTDGRSAPAIASVVIPAYGGSALLARCLGALSRLRDAVRFETVVVLNGPGVAWTDEHAAVAPDATVVGSDVNLGFGGGCNLGASAASGDLLVFLNDDATVRDGWLAALVRTADMRPDAGAVGSRMVSADGTLLEAGAVVFTNGFTMPVGRGLGEGSLEWDFVREVDYCSGASLLVRRAAWEAAGGFDEDYHPAYCEDTDLCFRLRSLGWTVLYEPRSSVEHESGMSTEEAYRTYLWRRNNERFVARWHEPLDGHLPPPAEPAVVRAAVERASERARGWPRHALVVAGQAGQGPDPAAQATVRRLAADGYSVSLAPLAGPAATTDELRDLGVRVLEELEESLARPETIVDVAHLVGHGASTALPLLRDLQPLTRIVFEQEAAIAAEPRTPIPCGRMAATSDESQAPAEDLAALSREKRHLLLDLAAKDGYVVELRTEIERLRTVTTELEARIAERDRRIEAMEALLHGRAHRLLETARRAARRVIPIKG